MDIAKIEVILRAIELKSFTKAANEYMYSTSALTQMADSLESEIGIQFIHRKHTGIEVCQGRENIVRSLRQLVKTKNQILKMAVDANTQQNTVTIATYASISKCIMPKVIKRFQASYPDAKIHMIVFDSWQGVCENYAVDLIFGEKTHNDEFQWEPILTDPYLAVLPRSFEVKSTAISREELLKSPFFMVKDRAIADYVKAGSGGTIVNTSSDDSSVIELIKEGLCVSILPRLTVGDSEAVQTLDLIPPFARSLGFSYREDAFRNKKTAQVFAQYLKNYIEAEIENQ